MFSVDAPRAAGHQANECGPLNEDGTPGIHQKGMLTRTYNSSVLPAAQFNVIATTIFAVAVVHMFMAPRFLRAAHRAQRDHEARCTAAGVANWPAAIILSATARLRLTWRARYTTPIPPRAISPSGS